MLAPDTSTRQPDLYERTQWLSTEFMRLARQFDEAATKLEAARAGRSFEGMRSAFLDIETFTDQAAQLSGSLQIAIANESQRRAKL